MSESTKVWAVWQGEYSDASVYGIYSTEDRANAIAAELTRREQRADGSRPYGGEATVYEYVLDEPATPPPGAFVVHVDDAGTVLHTQWKDEADPNAPAAIPELDRWDRGRRRFVGYGETPEHARRSAEELRRVTWTTPAPPPE